MKTIRELLLRADESHLLRPSHPDLYSEKVLNLEYKRTALSGVEFAYDPVNDIISDAWQTVDGHVIDTRVLIDEIAEALSEEPTDYVSASDEQPCQHQRRERRWLVREETSVSAITPEEAIVKVVNNTGDQEVISQFAEPVEDVVEDWPVHIVVLKFARDPQADDPINWDWNELDAALTPMVDNVEFITGGVIGTREVTR